MLAEAYIGKTDVYFGTGASMNRCNHIGGANPAWQYSIMDGNSDATGIPERH